MDDIPTSARGQDEDELVGALRDMVVTMDRDNDEADAKVLVADMTADDERAAQAPEAVDSAVELEPWPKPSSGT